MTRSNYSVSVTVRVRGNREVGARIDKKNLPDEVRTKNDDAAPLTKQILTWGADEYL